ncbi:hypothetical protein N181_21645 [Sinorhizobium fredii USDA 205]|uniref:Glycine-rich cell wall protein n=1 Tax=Rhizobium fredii TaxID=380 RepID=A0A844ADU4_RHIFR|nr:hypothetical protein [Sinorhizobium fredii]KSV86332.1 hypothetical protein N181_21645 [Sinorhizobium fredii USDA 205]MQX09630.1 hypothetical protein [Sinorhizobium fredii]
MIFCRSNARTHGQKFVAVLCTVTISFVLASLPYKATLTDSALELSLQSALAKNGGNGGNGNGGGGGSGNGNGGGNGNGKGGSNSSSSSRSSSSSSTGAKAKATTVGTFGSILKIRHVEGISEEIRNGRYIMKDGRGRTIVNRRATSADQKRLLSLID